MEIAEHFYTDDPRRGPADARTTLEGADYFFLGNGLIQAAVQVCHDQPGTPLGLLVMNPNRMGPKRAALTFDPEDGLKATQVTIRTDSHSCRPSGARLRARWSDVGGVPAVLVSWQDQDVSVEECFFCPDTKTPRLLREVRISTITPEETRIVVETGGGRECLTDRRTISQTDTACVRFSYSLQDDGGHLDVTVSVCSTLPEPATAQAHWHDLARFACSNDTLNHLFTAARNQLPAAVSACGVMDGSIWQYNREWVRDQSVVADVLAMLGERTKACTMITRMLREFVTDAGDTVDSSLRRPPADVELDQNGQLLRALESYVLWTGEDAPVHEHWPRVRAAADFPLREVFRHEPSGLLHNAREFWERHAAHGIKDGMELMHQYSVAVGLASAARLARRVGRPAEAERWMRAADRIRDALLNDERFGLVADGHLIKRRCVDGSVQTQITAAREAELPAGIPLTDAGPHYLDPDAGAALPIAMQFIDPKGDLARVTLRHLEELWNQRWAGGGYGRYHVTSEPDSPGAWPFPSVFLARAYFEAEDDAKVWRVLNWLAEVGGAAGSWREYYGPRMAPPYPQVGYVPWTWAEILYFFIHHLLGVRPGHDELVLRPRLLSGLEWAEARLRVRGHIVELHVRRAGDRPPGFHIGNTFHALDARGVRLPLPNEDMRVEALLGD
ncbi:MAG: hypothetical protein KKB50_06380 [Planctomycetes bacterium]|nr:hypothetical protein [Planctomycetota bacterium]